MNTQAPTSGSSPARSRSGGRAARRAARAAPLAENLRPIRAGMSGGTYQPLTQDGMERIHTAALDALEQIGLADAPPSGVKHLVGAFSGEVYVTSKPNQGTTFHIVFPLTVPSSDVN